MATGPVSVEQMDWTAVEDGPAGVRRAAVSAEAGARALSCHCYRVPPDTTSWRPRYHTANEQAIYVLSGRGRIDLGTGSERFALEPGTYVALPTGPAGTHEVAAAGDGELTMFVFSTTADPEITVFPRDGEARLRAGGPPDAAPSERMLAETVELAPPAVDEESLPAPETFVVDGDSLTWTHYEHGERTFRRRRVADAAGGLAIGCSQYAVPAGKRTWLRHWHGGNEEALYALSGAGTLRLGPEATEHALTAGDYVALPADERGTHEVVAGGDGLEYLAFSEMNDPDVTTYPDRRMVGLYVGAAPGGDATERTLSTYLDLDAERDYWEE